MAKRDFRFPDEVLERVNECSYGGFVLFSFDDKGRPIVNSMLDNELNAIALQSFISNWAKAVEQYNMQQTMDGIASSKKRREDT